MPGTDPYAWIVGRHVTVNQPGLYCLGFRLMDTSTNGPGGGAIHAASERYFVHLQAGLTVSSLVREGPSVTAVFGGEPGRTFFLERTTALGPSAQWETVAGPLAGGNRLQSLTDDAAISPEGFFRVRSTVP
jgi:hypothetical protein